MRSQHSLFKIGPFGNTKLNLAALASLALVLIVALVPPIAHVFGLIALPLKLYAWALGLILIPVAAMEIAKALRLTRH